MTYARRGESTSAVEVANVSPHGFWLLVGEHEHFLSFKDFPWFRDATIAELTNVRLPSPHHLHWPSLDIDLAVDALDHPEKYPLVGRPRPKTRAKPTQSRIRKTTRG